MPYSRARYSRSIVIKIFDTAGNIIRVTPAQFTSITLTATSIVIQVVKQDLPKDASASQATGNVGDLGYTFYASGPGWTWGGVHG
jgi:hypothetical protein